MNNTYMHFITKYARIMVAILLAFLASEIMVKEVFLGYTPQVRPDLANRVVDSTLALVNIDSYRAWINGETRQERINRLALEQENYTNTITPGVYAKETSTASELYINVEEVEWVTIPYVKKNGETINLNIPAGVEPPPPGLL